MTIREAFGKLAVATAKGMKNPFFVIRNLHKEFKDIQDNVTSCGLVQDAKDIDYDNTNSGLTAENAQAAIDELAGAVDRGKVSVTADGVKTASEIFAELFGLVDFSKVSNNATLRLASYFYKLLYNDGSKLTFTYSLVSADVKIQTISIGSTPAFKECHITTAGAVSIVDQSSFVPGNGTVYTLYY